MPNQENNKEKKECCEMCLYDKRHGKREMCKYCPCHSDPLTSLLQSAEREFEEKYRTAFLQMLTDLKIAQVKDRDGAIFTFTRDFSQSFLLSKLTEAFNKGKEKR